jgi:hypothetical protein
VEIVVHQMGMHKSNSRILYIGLLNEVQPLHLIDKNNQPDKQPYMGHQNNACMQQKWIVHQAYHPEL